MPASCERSLNQSTYPYAILQKKKLSIMEIPEKVTGLKIRISCDFSDISLELICTKKAGNLATILVKILGTSHKIALYFSL